MRISKNQSKFECRLIRKQYIELMIDFYVLTFREKDTFNFGTSLDNIYQKKFC